MRARISARPLGSRVYVTVVCASRARLEAFADKTGARVRPES